MVAIGSSETLATSYQVTEPCNPKENSLKKFIFETFVLEDDYLEARLMMHVTIITESLCVASRCDMQIKRRGGGAVVSRSQVHFYAVLVYILCDVF